MTWLAIVGLGVWLFIQNGRLTRLGAQLARLNEQLEQMRRTAVGQPSAVEVAAEVAAEVASGAAMRAPIPQAEPTPFLWRPKPEPEPSSVIVATTATPQPRPTRPDEPTIPGRSISEWLSENGLAWLGGGALALGGLLLVAYAAQHGFFTPGLRIIAAAVLGFSALGVGEWLRRNDQAEAPRNPLVAALTTAAGAAILYAAVWAAQVLYGYIPVSAAAVLLATISLGLLGLALLHGEALGLLAIAAAFAVPAVSGGGHWAGWPLDAYLALITLTGSVAAGLRAWLKVAAATLIFAALWSAQRLFGPDEGGVALLAILGPVGVLAAIDVARRGLPDDAPQAEPRAGLAAVLPSAAIIVGSVLALALYVASSPTSPLAAVIVAALAVMAALAADRKLADRTLLIAPAAAIVVAVMAFWGEQAFGLIIHAVWLLPAIAAVAAAGLYGGLSKDRGVAAAAIGAGATALTLTLISTALPRTLDGHDGLIAAGFAVALTIGVIALARRAQDPRTDLSTAAWIAAAAETAGLALHAGVDDRAAPVGYALIGLILAGLASRLKWRGFAQSTAVAGLASFSALLTPAILGGAFAGTQHWWNILLIAAAATAIQAAAWRALKTADGVANSVEATSTMALLTGLAGAFLVLRAIGAGPHSGAGLDHFTEASLRTLLILAAGLLLVIRGPTTDWGRARAPIFLLAGVAHGLVLQGGVLNPWWGTTETVIGPPILDSLLIGLLAPALLLAEAARRLAKDLRALAAAAAISALVFMLLWIATEIRRLFHGPQLGGDDFGFAEVGAYAVALLATSLGLERGRERLRRGLGDDGPLDWTLNGLAWIAAVGGLWLLGFVASPWWGPIDGDLHAPALLAATYILGALLTVALGGGAGPDRVIFSRFVAIAAGIEAFALLTLAIRYGFHGQAMRAPLKEAGLETWTFSAAWALYGLVILALGVRRRHLALRWLGLAVLLGTTAKVFMFDMARLEGVIRAASFLALGALLLIGALAARRLGQPSKPADAAPGAAP